jgi:NADP-dependent 3-hydroxy acid dehydrogenase YdfG
MGQLGAELFLSARTIEKAQATAQLVKEVTPAAKVHTFKADLSTPSDIVSFAKDVRAITDHIDILINNASFWLNGNIDNSSDEDIIQTIDSTATGSILITKHFLPLLDESKAADIVFINSTAGIENNSLDSCHEAFSAAKAGQSAFAQRLRNRLKGSGIRFLCVYPPNFDNPSPLNQQQWNEQCGVNNTRYLSARNVFNCITFALSQDRICSIDKIIMSNNT